VAMLVVWYTSGLAYLFSVLMAHQNAQIAAVSVTVVSGGFLNGVQPRYRDLSKTMRIVTGAVLPDWTLSRSTSSCRCGVGLLGSVQNHLRCHRCGS
jgi:hypothetical protein